MHCLVSHSPPPFFSHVNWIAVMGFHIHIEQPLRFLLLIYLPFQSSPFEYEQAINNTVLIPLLLGDGVSIHFWALWWRYKEQGPHLKKYHDTCYL